MFRYQNRVALVTGAGSGLGRALAFELVRRHCHVAITDVDKPRAEAVAHELSQTGPLVTAHALDVSSAADWERVAQEAIRRHRSLDLLINNAGISVSMPFGDVPAEVFDRAMEVNFRGAVLGCRAILPLLRRQPGSRILNVASSFAWLGYPGKTAYAASKGALRAFSESLRLELASEGIGVTLLYPGPLHTAIVRDGISESPEKVLAEDRFLSRRGLAPDRVARIALNRLASNPSRIVIGFDYRMLDLLARLAPGAAIRLMGWVAGRTGF